MRIWFDLTNSPHVNFFTDLIEDLSAEHELIITCRSLANTIELLHLKGLPYHVVGRHYGRNTAAKVVGFGIRVAQLAWFLRKYKIDAAISHSSYYSPLVSRMFGVPSLYLTDNEHAAGNWIAFRFADMVVVPECFPASALFDQGGAPGKIIRHPGVKEGIYLWKRPLPRRVGGPGRKCIYVRPEPRAAHYYRGRIDFLEPLLETLGKTHDVIVLPRGREQAVQYQ